MMEWSSSWCSRPDGFILHLINIFSIVPSGFLIPNGSDIKKDAAMSVDFSGLRFV